MHTYYHHRGSRENLIQKLSCLQPQRACRASTTLAPKSPGTGKARLPACSDQHMLSAPLCKLPLGPKPPPHSPCSESISHLIHPVRQNRSKKLGEYDYAHSYPAGARCKQAGLTVWSGKQREEVHS